ncbi:hypothetical protein IB237_09205 [Agrobacterium sp. AGB01]|uniref:hypothetical protein n=1 Tax=Agrobacterium sp. AGB01 TaxID=2769302 RepID=UPI00177C6C32|nr:hypothetical protein [Agrobacterium sp. AGB01]MBD9387350.1 hypothetical protein [Agrobacterium sp. AGB01]
MSSLRLSSTRFWGGGVALLIRMDLTRSNSRETASIGLRTRKVAARIVVSS